MTLFSGVLHLKGRADEIRPKVEAKLHLREGDIVAFLGGSEVAATRDSGHLESLLALEFAPLRPRFRNFGWEGDTVYHRPREINFPDPLTLLKQAGVSVIVVEYGRAESLDGAARVGEFVAAYGRWIRDLSAVTPRIVLVTPPPFESAPAPLPDLASRNEDLALYASAIRALAEDSGLPVIDLFGSLSRASKRDRLTLDGLQFSPAGHARVAEEFIRLVLGRGAADTGGAHSSGVWNDPRREKVRQAVLAKNRLWFDFWRPQNWAFLGGDRTEQPSSRDHRDPKVRWFPEEMRRYLPLIERAEASIETILREATSE